MHAAVIGVSALLLGAGAINLGLGLQASLLGLRAVHEGFDVVTTGLIMSSYYLGFSGGSLVAPSIVNRAGHIRTFSAFASLASAAALCHAVVVEPLSWMVFRALTGVCFAVLCLVAESWLNERSTNMDRGRLLAVYFTVNLAATSAGQMLLTLAPVTGYDLFVLVSVVISLALVPVALTSTPTPAQISLERVHPKRLFDISPVGFAGCLGAGFIAGALWSLAAVYGRESGLDKDDTALFVAVMILGGLVTQWPLGRLSDKLDRRYVIAAVSFGIAALGALVATGVASGGNLIFAAGALTGGMVLPLYGLSIAHTNDHIEAKDFVSASSSLLLVYGVGAVIGPFAATLAMRAFGPGGLFGHVGVIGVAVGVFALYRITQRAPVPLDQTEPFVVAPRTSPMAFELDPRSETGAPD
ncbi:MAG: MFS transporter [Alphaproteobacteria bacterium]|nr:MFS transporter [Alphaproteobacteria bacterium]